MANSNPTADDLESASLARHWTIDESVTFLNHGSFGACPGAVLERQAALRTELEREPVSFLVRSLEPRLDASRTELARLVVADPDDLVFVANATAGVNTVLRSLDFLPGDEILITDHAYNAARNAVDFVASRSGAAVAVAKVPFPIESEGTFVDAVLAACSARTKLAVLDHVTSPTALVVPLTRLVSELATRGIDTLVDGAHAPGMLPLDVQRIGATYYTGNCHKWLCAPKGVGFLHVRADRQSEIRPLVISHGANSTRTDRTRFQLEFGWTGTSDPTPALCVGHAIHHLDSLLPGGWPEIMARNHRLAARAREVLCEQLELIAPCPESMLGSMSALVLPPARQATSERRLGDPLQEQLLEHYRIEVPVFPWPTWPQRLVRVSAQLYNSVDQYRRLAESLRECL